MPKKEKKGEMAEKKPLWSARTRGKISELNILYTTGRDVQGQPPADELLIPYDLWTMKAHVVMLHKQKILPEAIAKPLLRGLLKLSELYLKNRFHLDPALEDVHSNVERFLQEHCGPEVSGWLPTARSRNDQIATDVRLYARDKLLELYWSTVELVEALVAKAGETAAMVMPGFTHMRPASLTSLGHYLVAYAQGLCGVLERLECTYQRINVSPMGAAASFGTSWNIDRKWVAEMLGFESVEENSLAAITHRWDKEAELVYSVCMLLNHLATLGQDLLLFTLPPYRFVEVDERFTTGSSIMPHKKNLDFAEVTRAKASSTLGLLQALLSFAPHAPSGYNRDLQWAKYILIAALDEVHYAPRLFKDIITTLQANAEAMHSQCHTHFLNALEVAEYLAQQLHLPFRTAYECVARAVRFDEKHGMLRRKSVNRALAEAKIKAEVTAKQWQQLEDPQELLERKAHLGAPAPAAVANTINSLRQVLRGYKQWHKTKEKNLEKAKRNLLEIVKKIS